MSQWLHVGFWTDNTEFWIDYEKVLLHLVSPGGNVSDVVTQYAEPPTQDNPAAELQRMIDESRVKKYIHLAYKVLSTLTNSCKPSPCGSWRGMPRCWQLGLRRGRRHD
jgi:hypothetical protein